VCVVVVCVDLLDEHTDNAKKYTTTLSDAHNKIWLKSGTVKTTQARLQASAAVRLEPSLCCWLHATWFCSLLPTFRECASIQLP